jgi:hypothetical protein
MNSLDEDFKTTLDDTHGKEIQRLRAQANSFALYKLLDGYTNSTAQMSTQSQREKWEEIRQRSNETASSAIGRFMTALDVYRHSLGGGAAPTNQDLITQLRFCLLEVIYNDCS